MTVNEGAINQSNSGKTIAPPHATDVERSPLLIEVNQDAIANDEKRSPLYVSAGMERSPLLLTAKQGAA